MDRGVWRATVYRVTKSWTRLEHLSMHAWWHVLLRMTFLIDIIYQYNKTNTIGL